MALIRAQIRVSDGGSVQSAALILRDPSRRLGPITLELDGGAGSGVPDPNLLEFSRSVFDEVETIGWRPAEVRISTTSTTNPVRTLALEQYELVSFEIIGRTRPPLEPPG